MLKSGPVNVFKCNEKYLGSLKRKSHILLPLDNTWLVIVGISNQSPVCREALWNENKFVNLLKLLVDVNSYSEIKYVATKALDCSVQLLITSMTRLGDLLDFGQLFKSLAIINLPKSSTLLRNFCKVVKIYHFSIEIVFGPLIQTFGDFFLVTLLTTIHSYTTTQLPSYG